MIFMICVFSCIDYIVIHKLLHYTCTVHVVNNYYLILLLTHINKVVPLQYPQLTVLFVFTLVTESVYVLVLLYKQ